MAAQVLHVVVAVVEVVALPVQKDVKAHRNHLLAQVAAVVVVADVLEVVSLLAVAVAQTHPRVAIVVAVKAIVIHHVGLLVLNIVPMAARRIVRQHALRLVIGVFVLEDVVVVAQRHAVEHVQYLALLHV